MASVWTETSERALPLHMRVRDLWSLGKPGLTWFVLLTAAGGVWLGKRSFGDASPMDAARGCALLLGVMMIVMGANTFNQVIERDIDRRMARTKNRPLPTGRMQPRTALAYGLVMSLGALPLLLWSSNILTTFLAALANLLYVFAYTPLKQRSHHAMAVGAVPGAMPPLLGWTAVTNELDAIGLTLFAILFFWQFPHFLAISLFRRHEYAKAGLVVMPHVRSTAQVKHAMASYTLMLVLVSLMLVPLGIAGPVYLIGAALFGAAMLGSVLVGFRTGDLDGKWPRSVFIASLVYIMALIVVLATDALL